MKKIILLTASTLALSSICSLALSPLVQANTFSGETSSSLVKNKNNDSEIVILDKGEFNSPILLDPYDFSLNSIGFNTGKIVFNYNSTSLTDLDETTAKYFNLKLPIEFNNISKIDHGEAIKEAITASYKLPGQTDYKNITMQDIDTTHSGQVNFKLPTSAIISKGEVTTFRVQINFGKILDSMNLGEDYDYTQQISNATGNSYNFKGALTSTDYFTSLPESAAIGYTDGNQAVH